MDQDGVSVTYKGSGFDDYDDYILDLYIENNSEATVIIQTTEASVNGFMTYSLISEEVGAGKKSNTKLSIWSDELEENGIDDVEEIEFKLIIVDPDSFETLLRPALLRST